MAKRKISKKDINTVRSAIEKSIRNVLTDKFVKNAIERAVGKVIETERKSSISKAGKKTAAKKTSKRKTAFRSLTGEIRRARKSVGGISVHRLRGASGGREPGPGPGH